MENNTKATDWGKALRIRRIALDMTQEQLASLSGSKVVYISELECGRRNPSGTTIIKLCHALDLKISEFARLAEDPPAIGKDKP